MTFDFDGQRAYDSVRHLAVEIGPHHAGSKADALAAAFVRSHFEGLGLAVTQQTVDVETGSILDYRVEILDPPLGEIPSCPVLLTPDTPPGGVEGEIVLVEGLAESQLGPQITGKIVLYVPIHSQPGGYERILRFRPLALLEIDRQIGVTPKSQNMTRIPVLPYDRVPTFHIAFEQGQRLIQAGVRRARVCLRSDCRAGKTTNVIGELRGQDHPEHIIVIGAHNDTVPGVPGATDDAAGVATVMELARVFAARGSRRTLRFAAWTAEECSLLGSRHYVENLLRAHREARATPGPDPSRDPSELQRHLLNVNLDVLGMTVGYNVCHSMAPAGVGAAISAIAGEMGVPLEVSGPQGNSDHVPFACAGVPAITFARLGPAAGYMHGPEDDISLVDAGHLAQLGGLVEVFLQRTAAGARAWPFQRNVPDEAVKYFAETTERWHLSAAAG